MNKSNNSVGQFQRVLICCISAMVYAPLLAWLLHKSDNEYLYLVVVRMWFDSTWFDSTCLCTTTHPPIDLSIRLPSVQTWWVDRMRGTRNLSSSLAVAGEYVMENEKQNLKTNHNATYSQSRFERKTHTALTKKKQPAHTQMCNFTEIRNVVEITLELQNLNLVEISTTVEIPNWNFNAWWHWFTCNVVVNARWNFNSRWNFNVEFQWNFNEI